MTTQEQKTYLESQLVNCTDSQKQRAKSELHHAENYRMFSSVTEFKTWVADSKKTFEQEATPEEITEVFNHLNI